MKPRTRARRLPELPPTEAGIVTSIEERSGLNLRCDCCGQIGGIGRVEREGVVFDSCEKCDRKGLVP